jgi:phage tail sheath protein FI
VSTSTAGFLGETLRGPEEPRLVPGYGEFERLYGGYLTGETTLPFTVDGFFRNGGQRCFIARIAAQDACTMTTVIDGKVTVSAIGPGTWGNRIAVKIEPGGLQAAGDPRFKLTVIYWDQAPPTPLVDPTDPTKITDPNYRVPNLLEAYDNLSAIKTELDFYEARVNGNSNLIRIKSAAAGIPATLALDMLSSSGTPGTDGSTIAIDDYLGRELPPLPDGTVNKSGLKGFEQVDEISIVSAPNQWSLPTLTTELINHCERLKDRFAILHSDPTKHTLDTIDNIVPPLDTQYAAFYFPWIMVYNPLTKQDSKVPPSGHIVGIYAKTDVERGVFKAPANEVVVGARSVEFQITEHEQGILNPKGVNCIRVFPERGILVWGARTSSSDSSWKYINVRRLFLFLEESIDEGLQWVVFEPNDEKLWARVEQSITQFLTTQWRNGALMGSTPKEAFFVKVDRTTMTQDDIDNGRLICLMGVASVKPAEFVIFRIARDTLKKC